MTNKIPIVDFFPYFQLTGIELLELRIKLLSEHVDKFVICESDKTQSGKPLQRNLKKVIENLNLPLDKIQIIELNIPDDPYLPVKEIDKINCYENNSTNIESVLARTRERLQKDSLLKVLHMFSDDTVFIVGDSDEIINPKHIQYIAKWVREIPTSIIKIPLVHLEGKADLRVYNKQTGIPKMWDKGMFFCIKEQLKKATPTMIRSNVNSPFQISYLTQNNTRLEDLGWHFSWMGNSLRRKIKRESFTHFNDTFSFLNNTSYNSESVVKIVEAKSFKEGDVPPSGDITETLKIYDSSLLPKEVFELSAVKNLLFN